MSNVISALNNERINFKLMKECVDDKWEI